MTLTLDLPPDIEESLQRRASREGVAISKLVLDAAVSISDAESASSAPPEDPDSPLARAREFYNRELRAKLEAEHLNQWVAIHPDTGDYLVEPRMGKAFRAMRARHSDGSVIVRNIGIADEGLRARILGERP